MVYQKGMDVDRKPAYKILVVDDDQVIKDLLKTFFASRGHSCETASDGDEALHKVAEIEPDAVITDIKIPGMDGIALTRELLKRRRDLSVMVMTGYTSEYGQEDAIDAGARDFITKPFSLSEFSARFQKMMRDRRDFETLKDLAHFDILTGLPNRALFFDRLAQILESARRYDYKFALLFMDLDNFKAINDTYGHHSGDLLLKEVAGRLMRCLRRSDIAARMGGDEFTAILDHISDYEEAAHVARRIIDSLSGSFYLKGCACTISASIGISLYPFDGDDAETLLKKADAAMYLVKEREGNNYRFYEYRQGDIQKESC